MSDLFRSRVVFAALLTLCPPVASQTLFGLDNGMAGAPAAPRLHHLTESCARISACFPPGLMPSTPSPRGGVALAECSSTIWSTDGVRLVHTDQSCNVLFVCPTGAVAGAEWTGLAVDEDRNRMIYTDGQLIIEREIPTSCPLPPPKSRCQLGAPFALPITGVEIDPFDGRFWICDSLGHVGSVSFTPTGVCRVHAFFPARCPSGALPVVPLQGITVDRCAKSPTGAPGVVTVTDSRGNIIRMSLAGAPISCCSFLGALGSGGRLVGLARNPIQPRVLGKGCSGPGCPPCLPVAYTKGESVIPTTCFNVALRDAPGQSRAYLILDTTSVAVPFGCGTVYVVGGVVLGPFPTGGAPGACDGSASVNLPIPNAPALCHLPLYFQWAVLCPGGGLALSNGLRVTLN